MALVDQGFRPGVFIGDASGSVPVGQQVFLCLRSPAFEIVCFLPRSPCLDTDRLMSCTAVKDFPEGAAQFCICCFLCVPTVGEAVARSSHEQSNSSCRRTWSRSSSSATSEATACNTSLCVFKRHLFHGGFEGSVLLRQSIQGLCCLLVHVECPVVRFSVLLVDGTEASNSVVQQAMEFSQPRPCSFLLRRHCRRRVSRSVRWRGARGVVRSDSSVISVTILDNLDLCHNRNLVTPSLSLVEPLGLLSSH